MKARTRLLCSIFLLIFTLIPRPAAADSAISKRLRRVAKKLTQDYESKRPNSTRIPLAVMTFHSNTALNRRRMGFALSSLLQQHFGKIATFRLVERRNLDTVLREQRLQLTGAVDPITAVEVGKLAGAKVLLMGSVEKLGALYQVHARLVDVESGDVLAVAYDELPKVLFEQEVKPFLAPLTQSVGIHFIYNYRKSGKTPPEGTFTHPIAGPSTLKPKSFDLSMAGVGLRYFPKRNMAADLAGMVFLDQPRVAESDALDGFGGQVNLTKGFSLRAAFSWVRYWSERSRTYLGGGLVTYNFGGEIFLQSEKALAPFLRAGYEWKAQERLGLALFFNYDLKKTTGKVDSRLGDHTVLELGRWSIEPNVTFYF